MSTFTKWLVDNGYTTSENKYDIESQISAVEADILYEHFLNDGGDAE